MPDRSQSQAVAKVHSIELKEQTVKVKKSLNLEQIRMSRKLIEGDITRMAMRIQNLENKNERDIQRILVDRQKTEKIIEQRYQNFCLKEQLRINRERDLLQRQEMVAKRNEFSDISGLRSNNARSAMEEHQRSLHQNYLSMKKQSKKDKKRRIRQESLELSRRRAEHEESRMHRAAE